MLKDFEYYYGSDGDHDYMNFGNGWVILPNGELRTDVSQVLKFDCVAEMGDACAMHYNRPVVDDELAIDWFYTAYVGHAFRVRHLPIRLTQEQLWRVNDIWNQIRSKWEDMSNTQMEYDTLAAGWGLEKLGIAVASVETIQAEEQPDSRNPLLDMPIQSIVTDRRVLNILESVEIYTVDELLQRARSHEAFSGIRGFGRTSLCATLDALEKNQLITHEERLIIFRLSLLQK